ncbi:class C sortase [uncultured Actinomyces sp.]|uniref:class C sortase n=1 Tax=uncultured Actinomyces sp. TaxID=249061 RepID=UPI0028D08393|nr:class C sortase [uncultured Actinomyces sp.]
MTALPPTRHRRLSRPPLTSPTDDEPAGSQGDDPREPDAPATRTEDPRAAQAPEVPGSLKGARRASRRRALRERFLNWLPLVLVLVGVAVLLYPVMATQHNNDEQQRLASMYTAAVNAADPDTITAKRASAEAYNNSLEGAPILDPWLESQRPDTPQYQAYLHELDIDTVMARIVVPSIHVSLPIYHGTETRTLADGVGHLFGTSLPIGGPSTHAVLTGHTGLPTATMFDNLTQVKKGDAFYISSLGQTLKYEVTDITVVKPEETDSLRKVPGRDLVTLVTCTPYGVNSHRLLVTGERVPMDPTAAAAEEAEALPTPMQTWMKVIVVAVVIILAVVFGILGRLWWLRRRARLASGAERAKGTDDSTDTGFPRDAQDTQDTADKVDDVGGVDHWPGRHLRDVAASPAACTADVAGEPSDDPPVGPHPREP